jgi:hypothetical protein
MAVHSRPIETIMPKANLHRVAGQLFRFLNKRSMHSRRRNVPAGKFIKVLKKKYGPVYGVAFGKDGSFYITSGMRCSMTRTALFCTIHITKGSGSVGYQSLAYKMFRRYVTS